MRIIKSIKESLRKLHEGLNPPPSKITLHLRRGTMAQIKEVKPNYVGEIVLCTDEPFLAVGRIYDYVLIPIPEEARTEFLVHYNDRPWMKRQLFWE